MEPKKRAHVWISGQVQGVFFRYETKRAADAQGVSGWVRNLRDGRVEALFEGNAADVKAMVQWCWKGSPKSSVQEVREQMEPFTGEYSGFDITG